MKQFIKDNLFQFIALIPICFIALGAFVLNIYLYQHGIIDIALFDSKTIFIGFILSFFFVSFFFFWKSFVTITGKLANLFLLILNTFWKPAIFSYIVFLTFGNSKILNTFSSSMLLRILILFAFLGFVTLPMIFLCQQKYNILYSNYKVDKIMLIIFIIILTLSSLSIYILCFFIESLKNITLMFFLISCYLLSCHLPIWLKKRSILLKQDRIINSVFTSGGKVGNFDIAFTICIFLSVLMYFLTTYSKNVYPEISSSLGGGRYKYNTIVLEDNSEIIGKIIHNNAEYVYIQTTDEELLQFPVNNILKYKINDNEVLSELKITD